MNLYATTLADFLLKNIRPCISGQVGTNEFRAVLSSYPADIIAQTGNLINESLIDNPQHIKFVFKVGYGLWNHWQESSNPSEKIFVTALENKSWIDREDKLTFYRNMKLEDFPDYEKLIIVLIGIDHARDSASLGDFFRVDSRAVWENGLKGSFIPWVSSLLDNHSIYSEEEQLNEIDSLLKQLYINSAGDLLQVVNYLQQLDLSSAQDGKDALTHMYENLDFWDLPKFIELPYRYKNKWSNYVQDAKTFFSYQKFLKNSERIKTIKNIELFSEKIENEEEDISFSDEFIDFEDLKTSLKAYVDKNDQAARERLLKTDFVPIRDKVILFKKKKSGPSSSKLTKIDGPPLESVLTALWHCLIDYKKTCNKDGIHPAENLNSIKISGIKFRHDLDQHNDGKDLLIGCLGGIDDYIEKQLNITTRVDEGQKEIPVSCNLLSENTDVPTYERSGAGVPGYQFKITLSTNTTYQFIRTFQWQIPKTQPYRNLWNLVKEIREILPESRPCLPVFTLDFYNEIFLASDEEEANRILMLGLKGLEIHDLLSLPELDLSDPFISEIHDLSHTYGLFLKSLEEEGYFVAIDEPWRKFRQKYEKILKAFLKVGDVGISNQFAPLMYKSFAFVAQNTLSEPFVSFLPNAVLTAIHPALLEMVTNRDTFLIHGFLSQASKIIEDTTSLKADLRQWNDVCDLAKIDYPLFGLVADASKSLNLDIQSHGLIHCLGSPPISNAPLSAKMILRAEENEEHELTDAFLFRDNRESRVIKRYLEDYVAIYPHASDGISIVVINPDSFQPIIAGINAFLKSQVENEISDEILPFHFSLTLFVSEDQQYEAARYLQEWKKRWELAQETTKFSYYKNCRLSIAHRISHGINDYVTLVSRDDFEADIVLLMNFISAGGLGNEVEPAEPFKVDLEHPLKFPVVETPRCSVKHPTQANVREKVISNRRFRLATLHSELGVYFKHPKYPKGLQYIVISSGDYTPWKDLIEKLHKCATWVVCLDPAIDEKLMGGNNSSTAKREIIGFSSGVGFRGELNYTLSTERASLADIEREVATQLNRICGPWDGDTLKTTSHCLVTNSRALSGLSLVRATGPGEREIRDLISSTIVRITLPAPISEKFLCDELISLDSFAHWFDTAPDPERPDLLRIVAYLNDDGIIRINAHIIECKLGQENTDHLNKAHIQLESGLRHLIDVFLPRGTHSIPKFDQRFWWAQLQRLVASKSIVSPDDQATVTNALEQLGEGNFSISWQAMVTAIWTDSDQDNFELIQQWDFTYRGYQTNIDVICAGAGIILPICKAEKEYIIPCSNDVICFPDKSNIHDSDESDSNDSTTQTKLPSIKHEKQEFNSTSISAKEGTDQKVTQPSEKPTDKQVVSEPEEVITHIVTPQGPPDRIFLGTTIGPTKREVFWEFGSEQLPNRHFLIFGKSGAGKTYAIQAILLELARQSQHSAIIDYTSGFLKSHLEDEFTSFVNPRGHIVKKTPLPINPFRRQRFVIDEDFEDIEDPYSVAGRITSVFTSVYSSFGDQQKPLLHKVIEQGVETYGDHYDFKKLLEDLENEESTNATTVANKLTPLGRANLFEGEKKDSWKEIYTDPEARVNIMQLAGLSRDLSKMATEFILWDLYDYASSQGNKDNPLPIILDEIQNLDHRLDSPLAKFLTEGRKFGISAILATQTLSNLSQEAQSRLFMASHKLFFRPADTELKEYATLLSNATGDNVNTWKDKLISLNKGECYSLGHSLNQKTGKLEEKAFPIQITSLGERIIQGND